MNRIQYTTQAFKTFVKDVKAPLEELRDELKAVLTRETVVHVVTFWHVDSMGGWNWYPAEAETDSRERYNLWEKELRDEDPQKGAVGLFRIVVPVAHSKNAYVINEYLEDLAGWDTFQDNGKLITEYRQNMGSMTGY